MALNFGNAVAFIDEPNNLQKSQIDTYRRILGEGPYAVTGKKVRMDEKKFKMEIVSIKGMDIFVPEDLLKYLYESFLQPGELAFLIDVKPDDDFYEQIKVFQPLLGKGPYLIDSLSPDPEIIVVISNVTDESVEVNKLFLYHAAYKIVNSA